MGGCISDEQVPAGSSVLRPVSPQLNQHKVHPESQQKESTQNPIPQHNLMTQYYYQSQLSPKVEQDRIFQEHHNR